MSAFTTTAGLHLGWEPDVLDRPVQRDLDYRATALVGSCSELAPADWSAPHIADVAQPEAPEPRRADAARGFVLAMVLGAAFWAGVAWLLV
jgi:hypothetical protein